MDILKTREQEEAEDAHDTARVNAVSRLRERLAWWQNDTAYKAPEQINKNYLERVLEDLATYLP